MSVRGALLVAIAAATLTAGCTSSGSGTPTTHSSSPSVTSSVTTATGTATMSAVTTPSGPPSYTGTVSTNWMTGVNFATLSHPDLDCAAAGEGGKVDILKQVSADVTGDGLPEAIVRAECAHGASEWPDSVYVYSDATGTPALIGTLLTQSGGSYASGLAVAAGVITVSTATWSAHAPGCCPDLFYTQTFTWNGHSFTAGTRKPDVRMCTDTSFAVAAGPSQGAAGHGILVLSFRNQGAQTCTVTGYPGVDALDAAGHALVHATRTLNGYGGGAHTIATLTVAPGQTVSATLEWLNFNPTTSGPCTFSHGISVTPANTTNTVHLNSPVSICSLQIHPTVAGTTGRDS